MKCPRSRVGLSRASLRLLVVTVACGLALAPAGHAYAEPSPADIERQLDQAWEKLEPIIEQYNGVRAQLAVDRVKVADLQQRIQP